MYVAINILIAILLHTTATTSTAVFLICPCKPLTIQLDLVFSLKAGKQSDISEFFDESRR